MTRLTTYIRDQIVTNALKKSGYTAAREAYNKRRAIWIEACRVRSLGITEAELLKAEGARLDEQYASVRTAVRAAVNKPTTIKALLAAWPEAKELLPEQLAEAKTQLPAVQVADLNALVGLPSE